MSYLWDFGDGSRSSETNPQHVYDQLGTYSASLTLSNENSSYSATPIEIAISEAQPESALCVFEVEEEWISGFRGKVTMTNTENVAIENWKVLMAFSDNTKLTGVWQGLHSGSNPYEITNENYNKTIHPGQSLDFGFNAQKAQENASPTATSLGGLCSPDGNINHPPSALASASVTSGEYPLTVNFDGNTSYELDEDPLTFTWDFGNGIKSNEPSPTYVFDKEGAFSVTLTVSDGVMNTVSEPILITVTAPEAPPISEPLTLNPLSSQLYFVSTKKQHLVEAHTFNTLSGSISPDGVAQFSIDLNSVDTNNETVSIYIPGGSIASLCSPSGSSENMQLGAISAGYEPVKNECNFMVNMSHSNAGHGRMPILLAENWGSDSYDVTMGNALGPNLPFRYLNLGVHSNGQGQLTKDNRNHLPFQENPFTVFKMVFESTQGSNSNPTIIDAHMSAANAIKSRLAGYEIQRMNDHLDAMSDTQKRLDDLYGGVSCGIAPDNTEFGLTFDTFSQQARLQADIAVAALQCNLTSSVSLAFGNHQSEFRIPELNFQGHYHNAIHGGSNGQPNYPYYTEMRSHLGSLSAYFIQKLKAAGILDSTIVL